MTPNKNKPKWEPSHRVRVALSAVRELGAAGYTIAPLSPSAAMLHAGELICPLSSETLTEIYQAMLLVESDGKNAMPIINRIFGVETLNWALQF